MFPPQEKRVRTEKPMGFVSLPLRQPGSKEDLVEPMPSLIEHLVTAKLFTFLLHTYLQNAHIAVGPH